MTLGTQAAVLAGRESSPYLLGLQTTGLTRFKLASQGLDVTMFIEFQPPPNEEWGAAFVMVPRTLKFLYYVSITSAFCANILVVAQTTILSVFGASLALRGPDGSMVTGRPRMCILLLLSSTT